VEASLHKKELQRNTYQRRNRGVVTKERGCSTGIQNLLIKFLMLVKDFDFRNERIGRKWPFDRIW